MKSIKETGNIPERDICVIKKQIKSDYVFPGDVSLRCRHGFPRIISMMPESGVFSDGSPDLSSAVYTALANVVWLTCPFLNEKIHRLENLGYIGRIETLLDSSRRLADELKLSHVNFFYLRKRKFAEIFEQNRGKNGIFDIFHSGVGGIRKERGLKCLHIHFAHYLLNGRNIAGCITSSLIGDAADCENADCGRFI